ncbi:DUF3324 domain-containing protein [Companilactobacillus kimchiensis]|nr:DUF3324 domain-containing protein [Companilactobacillus kimchiensis]
MKKIYAKSLILFAFLMAIIVGSNNITNVSAATSGEYALKVGGSNNDNLNIDNGSYVVTGDPGQKIELKLLVLNKSKVTRQFTFYGNTAYTTNSGELAYDKTDVKDSSLKYPMRKLISPNKSVFKVPGSTTATLTFHVTIPEKNFKGTLMGGVTVAPYKEKAKGTVGENGTLIKNKFSYSIPVQVHQKGADNAEAKYSVTTVTPNLVNGNDGRTQGVNANVHNSTNSYTGNLTAKAIVTKKGDKSFKITKITQNQQIAPTSNFNFAIPWGKRSLQAGSYHLKLTYSTAGGIKSWVIDKDFTITNDDAAKYNKLAGIKPNYLWLYILLAILALAIILGLGIYLGRRNNNNNKNNNGNNNSGNTSRRRRR